MTINDIKFYYSVGLGDPNDCEEQFGLGGPRSNCVLSALFDDVDSSQSRRGLVDYRCFYVKNTHATQTLRDARLYIDSERRGGSIIDLGLSREDEVQKIQITGMQPPAEGDYMLVTIPGYKTGLKIYYHANQTAWQGHMQTEVRSVDGLGGVLVSVAGTIGFPTDIVFTVNFVGQARSRQVSPMTVDVTQLGDQAAVVSTTRNGSPINTTAVLINSYTTAPANVAFDYPLRGNPVQLGNLRPGDEFPVWVRRTTPEKTTARIEDNFVLNIDGTFP